MGGVEVKYNYFHLKINLTILNLYKKLNQKFK